MIFDTVPRELARGRVWTIKLGGKDMTYQEYWAQVESCAIEITWGFLTHLIGAFLESR